jgi:hypothetical protein
MRAVRLGSFGFMDSLFAEVHEFGAKMMEPPARGRRFNSEGWYVCRSPKCGNEIVGRPEQTIFELFC